MTLQIGAMIVGLLLVSAAGLWGLNGLHQDYGLAVAKYLELGEVYRVGSQLRIAESLLPDRRAAAERVEIAARHFDLYVPERGTPGDDPEDRHAEASMRAALIAAVKQLRSTPSTTVERNDLQIADGHAVLDALAKMGSLVSTTHHTITARQEAAVRKRRDTMIAVGLLCGVIVFGAVLLGFFQYRSVMLPLHRLGGGVRQIAAGQFQQRLSERGSQEFADLANEFNRMAADLDEFYHRLEQKVADKSRQLVRSERLASVGYLAAGVAHEINNPLGIIAGYAEYTLSQLRQTPAPSGADDLHKSLQTICDEAFRCKEIIGKLLSLARPGEAQRGIVNLADVADDVVAAVGGLGDYRDRSLKVVAEHRDQLSVQGVEGEIKQVVLNLTINALEAVAPGGEVRIEVARAGTWVELRVKDNGRGMTEQTLERIFEPFFTEKRGSRQPGTGLGLSISHAIVSSHGGEIQASSAGLGKGSEFVVRLPARLVDTKQTQAVKRSVA